MKKKVQDAYSEILRLRNEFYQKWQEASQYDDNRGAYKAKYEAFDKALELLTPSIVDPQLEDPDKLTHSKVTKTSDQEESTKKCMYSKDNFTDEDRKVLCEGCEEDCEYSRKEESESEDLEKELDRYLPSVFNKDMDGGNPKFTTWFKALRKTARHFANWQKQQMMKDAIEGIVTTNIDGWINVMTGFIRPKEAGANFGDKVKLIIIKEE